MRKFTVMLVLVGILLCIVPVKVEAAQYIQVGTTNEYASDSPVSLGSYGQINTGNGKYVYTDTTNGIKEWTFSATLSKDTSVIYLGLVPNNIEIQEIVAGSNFLLASETNGQDGVKYVLLVASTTLKAGQTVELFKITTKDDDVEKNCVLGFSPMTVGPCDIIDGNYFDDNGNTITKEEYEEVCGEPVDPEDPDVPAEPENPQTGSAIPYIAVGGGILAIAGVFLYSRKSNKVYKL